MNEGVYLGPYIALKKLLIPQGPGEVPSSIRVYVNDVFNFDGNEPIDINRLLQSQAIQPYTGALDELEVK